MAEPLKALSGPALRKYFRTLLASERGLSPATARRLAEICSREIARVHVRRPLVRRRPIGQTSEPAAPVATPIVIAVPVIVAKPAALATVPVAREPAEPPFDPFAFSLIVVLRREGRQALLQRLERITSISDLRRLAEAQHVGIGEAAQTIDEVRAAVIAGAEARIADRLAAAS